LVIVLTGSFQLLRTPSPNHLPQLIPQLMQMEKLVSFINQKRKSIPKTKKVGKMTQTKWCLTTRAKVLVWKGTLILMMTTEFLNILSLCILHHLVIVIYHDLMYQSRLDNGPMNHLRADRIQDADAKTKTAITITTA